MVPYASFSTERTNELGDPRAEEAEVYKFGLSPRKRYDLCEVFLQVLEGKSFYKQLPISQYLLRCHHLSPSRRMLGEGISSGQPLGRRVKDSAPHYPGGARRSKDCTWDI